ncbi:hypothetical protein ASZ78_005641 [Callipepla squamata]|uniref:Rab9 effector protein with kelch motifs n=1 Tax=Callipepla squamata TaxID=9009 RepID=A0A226NIB3_CALSU|nr:hypothetical protein ASZ78_005641 [Callipepla squamata]
MAPRALPLLEPGGRPRPGRWTFHTSSAAIGDCLYVFGGGDKGAEPVKDQQLHVFDTADMKWVKIAATGDVPGGRASHSSAVFKDHLYIFGGIGPDGTLDTAYKYHIGRETSLSFGMVNASLFENAFWFQFLVFILLVITVTALEIQQYKTK